MDLPSKLAAETTTTERDNGSPTRDRSLSARIGWQAAASLVISLITILGVAGFLGFFWFAGLDNHIWHKIMIAGWATRAVTIATLVLRLAIDLQVGIAAAMLAAVLLESCSVQLHAAAKASIMRATAPQPRLMLDLVPGIIGPKWTSTSRGPASCIAAILLLVLTTTALQFCSTILLTDLALGQLPSLAIERTAAYDFNYGTYGNMQPVAPGVAMGIDGIVGGSYPIQLRTPTWSRNPPSYPAFGEYSRQLAPIDGVDDTGVLLRAFVPFADAQSRETLRNYSGPAMVLDSRVCIYHLTQLLHAVI